MPRERRSRYARLMVGAMICAALSLAACSPAPQKRAAPPAPDPLATAIAATLVRYSNTDLVRAIIVTVNGRTRFERYYSATASDYQPVWSVTKSIVSTLVGIAIEEGRLRLDERLSQMLPRYAADMTPSVGRVTLRQLLTMTAGFTDTFNGGGDALFAAPDWTRFILGHKDFTPGREFHYSDFGVDLLSPILVQATGQSVLAYARSKLFDPLGIPTTPSREPQVDQAHVSDFLAPGFAWSIDPQGFDTTAGGLKLRPRDMAAFGQLFLQKGQWNDRQIVSSSWVRQATSAQAGAAFSVFAPIGAFDPANYGYLWWVEPVGGHPAFFAHGLGGQLIEVAPAQHLVIVMSSFVDITDPNAITVDPDVEQKIADAIVTAVRNAD
jgi:CubicO group peptidase (beta-lactamase class C family)